MWTLKAGAIEKSFTDWGFTDPVMNLNSGTMSTFEVFKPGAADLVNGPPIDYFEQVTIWRGRSAVGAGGSIVFQGRMIQERRRADSRGPGRALTFADAWHELKNLVFQQTWQYHILSDVPAAQFYSRLNLFQDFATGHLLNSGQQIVEILNYAITYGGVNLQVGTVDVAFPLAIYPVKAIMCSEAIQICMRPTADAVAWIDYSTTPPKFNCRQQVNLAAVSMPYKDGATHESSDIVPRYDLLCPGVVIQYQQTNVIDGVPNTIFFNDAFPPDATGQDVGSLVAPIDLRGSQRTDIHVLVTAAAMAQTTTAWWQKKKPELASANVSGLAIVGTPTVKDEAGTDVDLTVYPNELVRGEVLPWMTDGFGNPILAKTVIVRAKFAYSQADANSRNIRKIVAANPHEVTLRLKLTNSAVGDVTYSATQHLETGELQPDGLAEAIFYSLQVLQHEGSHTARAGSNASETMALVTTGNVLNLTGGAAAWATMLAMVQQVQVDFFRSKQTIQFGARKHLMPGELFELLALWRFRQVFDNPGLRISALDGGAGGNTIGGDMSKENTSSGLPPMSKLVLSAEF